jgi:hypothetical protein
MRERSAILSQNNFRTDMITPSVGEEQEQGLSTDKPLHGQSTAAEAALLILTAGQEVVG